MASGGGPPPPAARATMRCVELIEQLRAELDGLSSEMNGHKSEREEYEKKFRAQLVEMERIQRMLQLLQEAHVEAKAQYEAEIQRLRRQLDARRNNSGSGSGDGGGAAAGGGGASAGGAGGGGKSAAGGGGGPSSGDGSSGGGGGGTAAGSGGGDGETGAAGGNPFADGPTRSPMAGGAGDEGNGSSGDAAKEAKRLNGAAEDGWTAKRARLDGAVGGGNGGASSQRSSSGGGGGDDRGGTVALGSGAQAAGGGSGGGAAAPPRPTPPGGAMAAKRGAPGSTAGGSGGRGVAAAGGIGGAENGGGGGTARAPVTVAVASAVASAMSVPATLNWRVEGHEGPLRSPSVALEKCEDLRSVVCCVRFSRDGTLVATGSHSCVKVFDVRTWRELFMRRKLTEDTHPDLDHYVRAVCFSPDGKRIAAGMEGNAVKIFDLQGDGEGSGGTMALSGHTAEVYSLDWVDDMLASGSGDGHVRLWSAADGRCRRPLGDSKDGPQDGVTSV
ncbi:unnamed protein product, partial [Phaeothamnion confervicola]